MTLRPQLPPQRTGGTEQHRRVSVAPPIPRKPVTSVSAVLQMTFEDFAKADCSVEIEVPWLRKHLWLVPTSAFAHALVGQGIERGCIWTGVRIDRPLCN